MAEFSETVTYKLHCPDCDSNRVVKVGKQNGQQRYLCRACDKKFRANGMPTGRQAPSEQMGMAIRMFYSGMSYKQIAETMADAFNIPEPSKSTLYDWVTDYTPQAVQTMRKPEYRATTGPEWVADEMQVTVGGKKYWNWNVMDSKTRFILASHLSRNRDLKAAETVMEKAAAAAKTHPKVIKSDRLASYPAAISLVFPETKHVQSDGIRAEVNNNLSERLQGTFRQRTKTLRGLENQESGQRYLDGWTLTYNFFREHESINDRTPGEAAKINSPYKEWEDVVREGAGVVEPTVIRPKVDSKPRVTPTEGTEAERPPIPDNVKIPEAQQVEPPKRIGEQRPRRSTAQLPKSKSGYAARPMRRASGAPAEIRRFARKATGKRR